LIKSTGRIPDSALQIINQFHTGKIAKWRCFKELSIYFNSKLKEDIPRVSFTRKGYPQMDGIE